jgi:hypothetical protein
VARSNAPGGRPAEPGALEQNEVVEIVGHERCAGRGRAKEMFVIRRPLKIRAERQGRLLAVGLEQAGELLRNVAVEIVGGHAGSAEIGHNPVIDDGPIPAVEGQRSANHLLGQLVVLHGLVD